jgi:hypothetical protein
MNKENELLEAALKLAESIKPYSLSEEERTLIEVIEQHRPKPKRMEGWVNLYGPDDHYMGFVWPTEQDAKDHASSNMLSQVHIREVIPVEWERWTAKTVQSLSFSAEAIVAAHNAEMERVTHNRGQ